MQHSTIAAIATAPGAGGIAIVRLSGPESYEVAAKEMCIRDRCIGASVMKLKG